MERENTESTRERLLKAATRLFALRGYEGATTRAITSEACANLQSIPFYFESKENLYQETVERTVKCFVENFEMVFKEIEETEKRGLLDKGAAWNYIVEIISRLSEFVLNDRYKYELLLINHNLLYPTDRIRMVMERLTLIYRYFARLLLTASGSGDVFWANNYSYMVLGIFFTHSNMPSFLETVVEMDLSDPDTVVRVKVQLKRDVLLSIENMIRVKSGGGV